MSLDTEKSRLICIPADFNEDSQSGFFDELGLAISEKPPSISLDCSLLDHATSSHINALWDALTKCERAGIPMRLISVGYGLDRVLHVLDLAELFSVELEDRPLEGSALSGTDRPTSKRFQVTMAATIADVVGVMKELHEFLSDLNITEICVFDLETVFYEVATNICRHSGMNEQSTINFTADLNLDEITLEFTDAGEPFDPTGNTPEFNPRRAIRRRQSRGIGLVMIQRIMDSITYERVDGRLNVVTLIRRLAPVRR